MIVPLSSRLSDMCPFDGERASFGSACPCPLLWPTEQGLEQGLCTTQLRFVGVNFLDQPPVGEAAGRANRNTCASARDA